MATARRLLVLLTAALLISASAGSAAFAKPKQEQPPTPADTPGPSPEDKTEQDFSAWLRDLAAEAVAKGIRAEVVHAALDGLRPAPVVITPRHRQAEFALSKKTYVSRLASEERYRKGRQKLAQHRTLLRRVAATYGIPPHYLVALWGIESDYGQGGRRHAVIRALATQAFQGHRQAFFRRQLLAALTILDREGLNREQLRGSWAGATGHFQFIPTTYLDYAVDFDGDGHRNIWTDMGDAMASAASYLARVGWQKGSGWGFRTVVPPGFDLTLAGLDKGRSPDRWRQAGLPVGADIEEQELALILPDGPEGDAFLVTGNFRALLRWNRSIAFALAVGHLADRLAQAPDTAVKSSP